MKKETLLQRAMVVNGLFSAEMLERHAGLNRNFVSGRLKSYEGAGFIKRSGVGDKGEKLWRMTMTGKRKFDPKAPMSVFQSSPRPVNVQSNRAERLKLKSSPRALMARDIDELPETKLWRAIQELGIFRMSELLSMDLASKSTAYQYCSALLRAGYLDKTHQKLQCNQCVYTVVKSTGEAAPVLGRALFLYDPNTNQIWDDIPRRMEIAGALEK